MPRKKKDKTSITIAIVMHVFIAFVVFVWAAKTGRLDPILKAFDVVLDQKKDEPKKPEPKKEEQVEEVKKEDLPKLTPPPQAMTPPPVGQQAAPPPVVAVAPPAAVLPAFDFTDGAKQVETSTNAPVLFYKSQVEYAFRSNWQRPEDMADTEYVAEIEVSIDPVGKVVKADWMKGSGDKRWDDSVKKAVAITKQLNRPPPKGFPDKFIVRFDVVGEAEPVVQ